MGLARLEFIINRMIGVHPRALLEFDRLDGELQEQIRTQMAGYADPVSFYVEKLAEGIAQIAAAFAPEPVIVRLSDFKSNEYANLIGGARYEPHEENPMLGFRGASRYIGRDLPSLLRARVPRAASACARPWASPTCRSWCRSCARVAEARQVTRAAGRERAGARRDGLQGHHDVRAADQRAAGR